MADFSRSRRSKNIVFQTWSKAEGRNVLVPLHDRTPFYQAEATAAEVRQLRQRGNYAFASNASETGSKHTRQFQQYADKQRETGPGGYRANRMKKRKKK